MKLTPLGKVVVGIVCLMFVGVAWTILKPEETGPDYSLPAELTFDSEKLPLTPAQDTAYRNKAQKATEYCNFFTGYEQNRGVPIQFDGYIPENYRASLYYHEDPKTGEQYLPVYFISPGGNGLQLAQRFADQDFERLPACVPPPEAGGSGGIIMVGFPRGRIPRGQYVRVYGELWWDSINLNPSQVETTEGQESGPAPVVKVATFQSLTASQAVDPANQTFVINTAIQRGPGVIRLSRLEFADTETRVWVELINLQPKALQPWAGTTRACIRPEGGDCALAGAEFETAATDEEAEVKSVINDTLPEEAPIPPSASGASLAGYLTFDRFDSEQKLQLELPDFSQSSGDAVTPPIIVQMPNESTSRSLESQETTKQLNK